MNGASKTIGLTGNIATGKSVVRRMLANSGALELDADQIAHRMIYPEGPAYHSVVKAFGDEILNEDQTISRWKLGEFAFNQPEKLALLESLIHPWVKKSILLRFETSISSLSVVEAIKLLEASLSAYCDSVWVSHVPEKIQLERLMQHRSMPEEEASDRISAQPPQSEKLAHANHVINTEGSLKSTWNQVQDALNDTIQIKMGISHKEFYGYNRFDIDDIHPIPIDRLEAFWQATSVDERSSFYEHFATHMVMPLVNNDHLQALMVWDNWNFTGTLQKVICAKELDLDPDTLLDTLENHGRQQQCEILFLADSVLQDSNLQPSANGYVYQTVDQLGYTAWYEAGQKLVSGGENLVWMKVLSQPLEVQGNMN